MKFGTLLLSLSLIAFAAAPGYADDAGKNKSDSQAKSTSASAGASGGASGVGATRAEFEKADTNKDGQLSRAEFDAMLKGDTSASAGASAKANDADKKSAK